MSICSDDIIEAEKYVSTCLTNAGFESKDGIDVSEIISEAFIFMYDNFPFHNKAYLFKSISIVVKETKRDVSIRKYEVRSKVDSTVEFRRCNKCCEDFTIDSFRKINVYRHKGYRYDNICITCRNAHVKHYNKTLTPEKKKDRNEYLRLYKQKKRKELAEWHVRDVLKRHSDNKSDFDKLSDKTYIQKKRIEIMIGRMLHMHPKGIIDTLRFMQDLA